MQKEQNYLFQLNNIIILNNTIAGMQLADPLLKKLEGISSDKFIQNNISLVHLCNIS